MNKHLSAFAAIAGLAVTGVASADLVTYEDFEDQDFTYNLQEADDAPNSATIVSPGLDGSNFALANVLDESDGAFNIAQISFADLVGFDTDNPLLEVTIRFDAEVPGTSGSFNRIRVLSNQFDANFRSARADSVNNDSGTDSFDFDDGTVITEQFDFSGDAVDLLTDPTNTNPGIRIVINKDAGVEGTYTIDNIRYNAVAVPEPASAALLGAAGLLGLRRRRNG